MTADELWEEFKKYTKQINDFPSIQSFATHTRLTYDLASKVYSRWLQQGKLIKNGTRYDLPEELKKELFKEKIEPLFTVEEPKKSVSKAVEHKKEIETVHAEESKLDNIFIGLKILAATVGFILVTVSIHLTFDFNKLGMFKVWAFLLSFAIVTYMGFAFTLKSYADTYLKKIAIVILWILGISYSVFTAVSGQYNDFRKYNASDESIVLENKTKVLNNQLKMLEEKQQLLSHWRYEEKDYTENPDLKTENPGTWRTIQNGVKSLEETEEKILEIQNQLLATVSVDVISEQTVYHWLSSFLHVNADKVQFWVTLFPALFIDLCSSLCLSFAFSKKPSDSHED